MIWLTAISLDPLGELISMHMIHDVVVFLKIKNMELCVNTDKMFALNYVIWLVYVSYIRLATNF